MAVLLPLPESANAQKKTNRNDVSRRRWLARIFAFIAIVCYDVHRGIKHHGAKSSAEGSGGDAGPPNHIHAVDRGPSSLNDTSVRISFSVHDPQAVPFHNAFVIRRCELGPLKKGGSRTDEVPPSLLLGGGLGTDHLPDVRRSGGRILDFTTTVSTNLKILQIGDSITIDVAESLDEMLGGAELGSRRSLWSAWFGADGGTIVAPTRGGGAHGAWRMTGLLSKSRQGLPHTMNDAKGYHAHALGGLGGGWNYNNVNPFLRHVYEWEGRNATVKTMDVVVFRVMHGWMTVEEITRERVVEAAELAHSILGASTIVFMTVPFTNNVKNDTIMEGVRKINDMIRDIARGWHRGHDTVLLVMEYGAYCNHVIWTNARHLGYDVSAPLTADPGAFDREGPRFLQERLKKERWPPSIPMVCARRPPPESGGAYCEQNLMFEDGMHFCTETMAARIGAGIACLLGCVYNRKGPETGPRRANNSTQLYSEGQILKIRACERQCNEQFLSVMPIKESWVVDSSTTLASFSGI